jgi:hypothetical protein
MMDKDALTDLYRIGSAATDAGLLDWLRTLVLSGAFVALVRSTFGRALTAILVVMTLAQAAVAQPAGLSNEEIERRLHFLDGKLAAEQSQARWYEGGWSLVYIGGVGYGAYQLGNAGDDKAAIAEGIVGISKSLIGAGTLVLKPLKAGHSLRDLYGHESDPAQRLALAESLLERNAKESDLRYAWQAHVIALALNLLGGAVIWIAGDLERAGQSTGIAIAAAEVQLWTLPWSAKRHVREYRREFGGFAF